MTRRDTHGSGGNEGSRRAPQRLTLARRPAEQGDAERKDLRLRRAPRLGRATDFTAIASTSTPTSTPTKAQRAPDRTQPDNSRDELAQVEHLRHVPENTKERLKQFLAQNPATQDLKSSGPSPAKAEKTSATDSNTQLPKVSLHDGELGAAIRASRDGFVAIGLFSFVINILMLTGPIFMLQVYDRVMTSGSMPTLIGLMLLAVASYGVIGALELVRSRITVRIGVDIDQRIGNRVFAAALKKSVAAQSSSTSVLRDLDTLKAFLAGPGPLTLFDAPWTPVYLAIIFLVHWSLGVAALAGAAILFILAVYSEQASRKPLASAGQAAVRSLELAETGQRNAEAIAAMGMLEAYRERWQKANQEALAWQVLAADKLGAVSSATKATRLLLQSLLLGLGAALAVRGQISAGSIIATTIIFGRALQPVEQAIQHWRGFVKARESYDRVKELLEKLPQEPVRTALPTPTGRLEVNGLRVAAPGSRQLILANLSFSVSPGQMLAVIGPSASGKSTLARTLVGLWPPFAGSIKLDGARLDQWDPEALGRHIGYLPQSVELFAGTVRENIARFREDATDDAVMAAAMMAHAHDLILALPNGYDTQLGAFGTYLSGGQRQRIALARALFGDPALVVLDEPNANLDRIGDDALAAAIDGMRSRGQAVVLISHRVQAIGKADLLLYVDRGVQRAFGPRDEVMKLFQPGQSNKVRSQGADASGPLSDVPDPGGPG